MAISIRNQAVGQKCSNKLKHQRKGEKLAFKDIFGVEYSDDRQTLLKCPTSLTGSYAVSPMVNTIGKEAFKGCALLSDIVLSDEIENIEQSAFEGCMGLSSVYIPRNVRRIDRKAFVHCENIENVCIEGFDIEIDRSAYMFCDKIKSVSISEGVNLKGCSGLNKAETVKVIKSVRITKEMLYGFRNMRKLHIPASISVIEGGALVDCNKLCEVIVDPYNQNYLDIEGVLYNHDKSDLLFLPRNWQGVFTVPNTVKRILEGAIKDCQSLTSVVISENVEMIGKQAFQFNRCPSLSSITVENNPNYCSIDGVLYDAKGNLLRCPEGISGKLSIPSIVKGIANGAFSSCNCLSIVEIPYSVDTIGVYAFSSYAGEIIVDSDSRSYVCHKGFLIDKINSLLVYANKSIAGHVDIDDNIVTIGHEAFCDCIELQSITFPFSLIEIQSGAFADCKNLTRVDFNEGIEIIGECAFLGCDKLEKVVIPNSVKEIKHAFDNTIVSEISIPVGIKSVFCFNAFEDDKECNYKSIKLNSGFETIEKELFKGCLAVTDITIPASVTTIKANAFDDCKALKNIHYEGTLEEWLGMKWFCYVKNGYNLYIGGELLTKVVLDGSITEIRENAFYYCNSLKHVEIREGVRIIGNSAFNKTGISGELYLPDSLEQIGDYAFLSCKNLKNISIPRTASLKNGLFRYCDNLESIVIRGANDASDAFTEDGVLFENHKLILLVGEDDGINHDERDNQLTLCHFPCGKKTTKYFVPTNVEAIGDYAFASVSNLTLVLRNYVLIEKNTFQNARITIQVPIGMKQVFINGKYPTDSIEEIRMPEVVDKKDLPKKCLHSIGKGFDDVAGMDELKEKLQIDIIKVLKNPEKAKKFGITIPNGILLYGPPGCGKTFFAEKLAEEIGCNFIYVKCSDVASPYIHGGQEKIAALFKEARDKAPTLLFLDEVEAMITDRTKHNTVSESGEVNEFLTQLNNCGQDGVTVIAATNKPDLIDKAALRSGRLALHYYIPQPSFETRKQLFEINLKKRAVGSGIDYEKLARMTENYSCSDIKEIVDNAGRIAFGSDSEYITQAMLESACIGLKSHLTLDVIKKYETIRDNFERNI